MCRLWKIPVRSGALGQGRTCKSAVGEDLGKLGDGKKVVRNVSGIRDGN